MTEASRPDAMGRPREDRIDDFLQGKCAAFAVGASRTFRIADDTPCISIMIDEHGEPNEPVPDDDGEFVGRCIAHAYLSLSDRDIDARGVRTPEEMADEYGFAAYGVDGPFTVRGFLSAFCCEDGPLECEEADVVDAADLVSTSPDLYPAQDQR